MDLASSSGSDGDALTLDLGDPILRALLRKLRLVVLVKGTADEFATTVTEGPQRAHPDSESKT